MTEQHPSRADWKERENMSEAKPKPPIKKELVMKVLRLKSHAFDTGNTKYAAKYKKMVNAIADHIQRE